MFRWWPVISKICFGQTKLRLYLCFLAFLMSSKCVLHSSATATPEDWNQIDHTENVLTIVTILVSGVLTCSGADWGRESGRGRHAAAPSPDGGTHARHGTRRWVMGPSEMRTSSIIVYTLLLAAICVSTNYEAMWSCFRTPYIWHVTGQSKFIRSIALRQV